MKNSAFILIVCLVAFFACKSINKTESVEDLSVIHNVNTKNKAWKDSLDIMKQELKRAWLDDFTPDMYFTGVLSEPQYKKSLYMPIKGDDFNQYDAIPVLVYQIDYNSFIAWSEETPIEEVLTLCRDRVGAFMVNKNTIVINSTLKFRVNAWDLSSSGPISIGIADTIANLYFNKHESVFYVNVATENTPKPYEKRFVVYYDNNVLKSLNSKGLNEPFKATLSNFKKVLLSGESW